MIESTDTDVELDGRRVSQFRIKVEEFSFRTPKNPPTRGSASTAPTTDRRPTKSETPSTVQDVFEASTPNSLSKKRVHDDAVGNTEGSPAKAKKKRGYAPPETYAHLDYLTDCIGEYLDVLFCGINPGVRSATVGHHFAHPGNRFYKMIHGAGFTDRLILPEEDSTLPSLYQVGITDIVDRPSSCEDELLAEEMIGGIPALLQKVAKYKPRFVCFIGKGMGQKVEKGFRKAIAASENSKLLQDGIAAFDQSFGKSPTKRKKGASPRENGVKQPEPGADGGVGLRPFKVTHGTDPTSSVRETLFFVSHSSSGLATSMNLQGKVDILKELRELVAKHKTGVLNTSCFGEIPVDRSATSVPFV